MIGQLAAAVMAIASPPPQTSANTLLCQSDLPDVQGSRLAWFNLKVDEGYKPLTAEVFVRTDDFDAAWKFTKKGFSAKDAMLNFESRLPLPSNAQFPIRITINADGRDIAELISLRGFVDVLLRSDKSTTDRLVAPISGKMIPNIFGVKKLALRATDGTGVEVANYLVPLPNWDWLKRESRRAAYSADRKRHMKDCGPSIVI